MSGAAAAGVVADGAIEDLRRLEIAVERDLFRFMLRLDTEAGEDALIKRQTQTQAFVLRQVQRRLEEAGEAVRSAAGARAVEAVEAVLGAPPSTLPLDVRTELDALVNGQMADVAAVFKAGAFEMRAAVAEGVLSGGSLADAVERVQGELRTTYRRAQAAVDAAIMAVGRRTVIAAAKDSGIPDLVYVYVGPKDVKNRPFCSQWVGKAVIDPENLDNGQGLPADDFCGGYNCRHSWAPAPIDDVVADGIPIYRSSGARYIVEV
ncbi:MAG TPA: hypothetical protein VMX11_04620 [Actinomycetes bacterium]|nr:hypothetical protein [Actinomycetes bacterium]